MSKGKPPARAVADTSVAVALALGGHPNHDASVLAVNEWAPALAGHAWFETFSVLSRLPDAFRLSATSARTIISHNFADVAWLTPQAQLSLTAALADTSIAGGAVYDAVVAASALMRALPMLTADRRAAKTYEALGVAWILIAGDELQAVH